MKTTVTLCLFLVLMACSEKSANEPSNADSKAATTVEKPNKFKVAAIKKVKLANSGFNETQATCVVEQMTADGKIGLGEINQMQLDATHMSQNASNLVTAYQSALNSCKG